MSASTSPAATSTVSTGSAPAGTAPPGSVLRGVLRTHGRSLAFFALAISAVTVLYTSFYPSIGGEKFAVLVEAMPPEMVEAMGMDTMTSASGYVSGTVYSLLGAILTLVCAISLGARLVAGGEEDLTLELELASPVSRAQAYVERLGSLWLMLLGVAAAMTVVLLVLAGLMDLDLAVGNVVAASLSLWVFGATLGTVAFAVGAATGRRGVALGVATAIAVLAYLMSYLGPLADADWMDQVSPYGWYIAEQPLRNGFDWSGLGLLLTLAVVAALAGWGRFRRRDLLV